MCLGYGTFEKETKNTTSNRSMYLSNETVKALKEWKKEQTTRRLLVGDKWEDSPRIFTTAFGADMHPNTPSKILEKIIRDNNLKRITFHGLRHTSITLLINSGVQTQIISKRAGHSNITTTHQIYSHFFNEEFEAVANTMDNILASVKCKEGN